MQVDVSSTQGRNQKIELKGAKMLVILLFRLNILILLREGLEKKFLAGAPAPPWLRPCLHHFYQVDNSRNAITFTSH